LERENKQAKGYQVVTLAEQVLVAAGDCIPTVMFTLNGCSGSIAEMLLFRASQLTICLLECGFVSGTETQRPQNEYLRIQATGGLLEKVTNR
jgi:hypothetical protein